MTPSSVSGIDARQRGDKHGKEFVAVLTRRQTLISPGLICGLIHQYVEGELLEKT